MGSVTEEQPDTLAMALALAQLGWHVFDVDHPDLPKCAGVRTREHDPDSCTDRGKHPACKWSTAATTDPERITAMFAGSLRNIGVACKPSGVVVIDEDAPGEFERFCTAVGQPVPDTMRVQTGKGFHHYFGAVEGVALGNAEGMLRGYAVNVRGAGGYVVGPGSVHQSGALYRAANGQSVMPLPGFIVAALTGRPAVATGDRSPAHPCRRITPGGVMPR